MDRVLLNGRGAKNLRYAGGDVDICRRRWGERTFRAISGGFMDPSRLRQSFAALGISRGPPNRKSLISWLFSELTAIFRTKRTITPMTAMSVSTVCVLMSFFALHYVALFPCSENVLAVHPEAAALVRKWNLHAMRVADQYEHE